MKLVLALTFVLILSGLNYAQTFDFSFHTGVDSSLSEITLLERRSDGDWIAAGKNVVCRFSDDGNLMWSKELDLPSPNCLSLDADNNIFVIQQKKDGNNYTHSYISKLNSNGFFIWHKKLGDDLYEVEANDLIDLDGDYFMLVGRMTNDTSAFNFVARFYANGTVDWARRVYIFPSEYTTFKKIDQAPDGYLYILGQRDFKTTVHRFSTTGGMSGLVQYTTPDSLIPVDIIAYGANDIHVLMNKYIYDDHFPKRTFVKMQLDHDLYIISAKEYSYSQNYYFAQDLETTENHCYILVNKIGDNEATLLVRTDLSGNFSLTREVYDMNESQRSNDMEVRPDRSIVFNYESDSTTIISSTNTYMQSTCDFHYSWINTTDIVITRQGATGMAFSGANIIVTEIPNDLTERTNLIEINYCFGVAGVTDESENIIQIYPQPASDFVQISSTKNIHLIELFDPRGNKVYEGTQTQIDLSNMSRGIYILHVSFDDGSPVSEKILKM